MVTSDENHNLIRHLPIKILLQLKYEQNAQFEQFKGWDHGLATVFFSTIFASLQFFPSSNDDDEAINE